jgi:class 3 adenylate cyclase/pimeloyl-ACP methyl ester carboxylesterase
MPPETRYAMGPDGAVGYQVFGQGPPDLVFITQWGTNIDMFWDEPSAARYLDRLATFSRVILFDKRGTGVSDPVESFDDLSVDDWLRDITTVMDDADSESAVVVGDAEGGLLAIAYADSHPDRVESLVLINSRARALRADDYREGMPEQVAEFSRQIFVNTYGIDHVDLEDTALASTAPSVMGDARFGRWFTKFQRSTMPPKMVRQGFDFQLGIDVREEAKRLDVPTLVINRSDAVYHRIEAGRWLANNIPGAVFVELGGADTLPFHTGDFNEILDHVEAFVAGEAKEIKSDRRLATVMFTDIVGSTERASDLGDEKWLDLLKEANKVSEGQVLRFGGVSVYTTGDGHLATFDAPANAVRAAQQVLFEVGTLGIELRSGIHTGEISVTGENIAGIGVHIASRVMDKAPDGRICVSSTVRDLTVGSSITYDPIGTFQLKGVPGEWSLFEVV